MKRSIITILTIMASGAALALDRGASADLILDLGHGWQATIFDPVHVDVTVDPDQSGEDQLVIQKFANFTAIDPITGLPEPVRIAFNQIASDEETASQIVITDELIFNNTGMSWGQYQNILLGGAATFDPLASAGFDISPFTVLSFSPDNQVAYFDGGTVGDGEAFTPGKDGGALVINVDLSGAEPAKFVLKELAIPGPGAIALVVLAVMAPRRRRTA
jgi:hypothetical protein